MTEQNAGDSFADRHIGPRPDEIENMLKVLGLSSLDDLVKATVPPSILKPGGYTPHFPWWGRRPAGCRHPIRMCRIFPFARLRGGKSAPLLLQPPGIN